MARRLQENVKVVGSEEIAEKFVAMFSPISGWRVLLSDKLHFLVGPERFSLDSMEITWFPQGRPIDIGNIYNLESKATRPSGIGAVYKYVTNLRPLSPFPELLWGGPTLLKILEFLNFKILKQWKIKCTVRPSYGKD